MGKRKRYTPAENIQILGEMVENGKPVSTVAENYGLRPNNI
jgi:transposase-like protein